MKYFDTDEQLHFLEACSKGDRLEVEKLLQSGIIDINFHHGINKWTALHWAAKRGHESLCVVLLKAGFSPEERDSQDRTPFDVCNPDSAIIRNLLKPSENILEMHEVEQQEVNGNKFTPGYIKYPNFPYSKQNSLDSSPNPSSPTTRGYYSYGRRDSATRTRFLLVRTSCAAGKEAFKRITLPGGSTVDELRKTVENAMKAGPVQSLMTLPDNVLIEEESQIEAFGNCQKIDVVFGEPLPTSTSSTPTKINIAVRRTSLFAPIRDDTPETSESLSAESETLKPATTVPSKTKELPNSCDTYVRISNFGEDLRVGDYWAGYFLPLLTLPMSQKSRIVKITASPLSSPLLMRREQNWEPIPDHSSKMNEGLVTPPPSPSNEIEELLKMGEEPVIEDPVQVSADFHLKKVKPLGETTESVSLPNTEQEIQDFSDDSKKWTTAQQVAAVAAAASLVGLGCYIYKLRK